MYKNEEANTMNNVLRLKKAVWKFVLVLLPTLLSMTALLPKLQVNVASMAKYGEGTRIFNLGLIIHDLNVTEKRWCMNWISQFDPFAKWNFILWPPYENLDDTTFLDFLRMRGLLMGVNGYMQSISLVERESEMDSMVDAFNAHNVTLNGFFMFQPDTYTMNYAHYHHNFEYYVGYCFDQYVIDYMTMKGGWQLPYYHNRDHALKPAEDDNGLVVFPHVTWDWVSSLTYSHHLSTHILGVYPHVYSNPSDAIDYSLRLINESLSCSQPFGYASTMFEWMWIIDHQDRNQTCIDYYQQIINQYGSIFQLYNETALWLKSTYSKTPTYRVTFTSPYDNQQVEWYLDTNYRIARVNNDVKSYVVFEDQTEYWLNNVSDVDLYSPASETNCITNSLEFKIDDLGGGLHRDSVRGDSMYYSGSLGDFPFAKFLTITSSEGGTTDAEPNIYAYESDTVVEVLAIPNAGYSFYCWLLDEEEKIENPVTVIMEVNCTLEAFFVDDVPPAIGVSVQNPPRSIKPYQKVTVTVSVIDAVSGVQNVTLLYSVNHGATWDLLHMTKNSTNSYQTTIPGHKTRTWVTYKIIAIDNNKNQATDDNHGYCYIYHVTMESLSRTPINLLPFIIVILLAIMVATLLTVKISQDISCNRKTRNRSERALNVSQMNIACAK